MASHTTGVDDGRSSRTAVAATAKTVRWWDGRTDGPVGRLVERCGWTTASQRPPAWVPFLEDYSPSSCLYGPSLVTQNVNRDAVANLVLVPAAG